jgi:hypothetical protein
MVGSIHESFDEGACLGYTMKGTYTIYVAIRSSAVQVNQHQLRNSKQYSILEGVLVWQKHSN